MQVQFVGGPLDGRVEEWSTTNGLIFFKVIDNYITERSEIHGVEINSCTIQPVEHRYDFDGGKLVYSGWRKM
jgi:hypothetical protein